MRSDGSGGSRRRRHRDKAAYLLGQVCVEGALCKISKVKLNKTMRSKLLGAYVGRDSS